MKINSRRLGCPIRQSQEVSKICTFRQCLRLVDRWKKKWTHLNCETKFLPKLWRLSRKQLTCKQRSTVIWFGLPKIAVSVFTGRNYGESKCSAEAHSEILSFSQCATPTTRIENALKISKQMRSRSSKLRMLTTTMECTLDAWLHRACFSSRWIFFTSTTMSTSPMRWSPKQRNTWRRSTVAVQVSPVFLSKFFSLQQQELLLHHALHSPLSARIWLFDPLSPFVYISNPMHFSSGKRIGKIFLNESLTPLVSPQ